MSEEQARKIATGIIESLDNNVSTRASVPRSIANVRALKISDSPRTRANIEREYGIVVPEGVEIPEQVAWAVEFEADNGYAVIAADTRIKETVLSVCEFGSLPEASEVPISNEGLYLFLEVSEIYAVLDIIDTERMKDSLTQSIVEKLEAELPDDLKTPDSDTRGFFSWMIEKMKYKTEVKIEQIGDLVVDSRVTPLIPTEWNQDEPWNNLVRYMRCPKISNGRAYAGCVAIAGAQILAMYKYPDKVDGLSLPWDDMNRYAGHYWERPNRYYLWEANFLEAPGPLRDLAARLVLNIGTAVGMDYGCEGSGAGVVDLAKWLNNNGYKMDNPLIFNSYPGFAYKSGRVTASIEKKHPVLISGFAKKIKHRFLGITFYTSYKEGHAWNIDGVIRGHYNYKMTTITRRRDNNRIVSSVSTCYSKPVTLHHHNWGHGGEGNGYYAADVFQKVAEPEYGSDTRAESGQKGNYQYDIRIWTNIQRK